MPTYESIKGLIHRLGRSLGTQSLDKIPLQAKKASIHKPFRGTQYSKPNEEKSTFLPTDSWANLKTN